MNFFSKHKPSIRISLLGVILILATWYYFCLPEQLFPNVHSTVLVDAEGKLLGAKIAKDEQWRFPHNDSVPRKLGKAITTFEDKRFFNHLGIDFIALGRAIKQNLFRQKIVSGASTISMQVIRLHRQGKARTFSEKIIELILSTRLEIRYSKKEILALYLCNTPYGGNVVGMDAAAWKYYGRSIYNLSWAESSTLAVLPNSPSLIHLSKNRDALKNKRNFLLRKLYKNNSIDSLSYALSISEPLTSKPRPLPQHTPHLLEKLRKKGQNKSIIQTSIELKIQKQVQQVLLQHLPKLEDNGIENVSALVIRPKDLKIVAYVGNKPSCFHSNGCQVDMIEAKRSTGSIIKPLLYAFMIDEGELLPTQLVPDIPMYYKGFSPKNYDKTYQGSVPVNSALSRSLNIPFAYLLSKYGYQKFHHRLKKVGFSTLKHHSDHYGLSLILGGAETTMWDLGRIYSNMAKTLIDYEKQSGNYDENQFKNISYINTVDSITYTNKHYLNASSIWNTFESMLKVNRPGIDKYWKQFSSTRKIAWKTGTSFGFRDAWAVGVTPEYVVVVWTGNADGEGRPNLVGAKSSGPILFDIFNTISTHKHWFTAPYDDLVKIEICKHSGHIASEQCIEKDTIETSEFGTKTKACSYCKLLHLDKNEQFQVNGSCYSPTQMKHKSFFNLPPLQESYYKNHHPEYQSLPPFPPNCEVHKENNITISYPHKNAKIYIPRAIDGEKSSVVFQAKHSNNMATIFWHIDNTYYGETTGNHDIVLDLQKGKHQLTIVDKLGETKSVNFEILSEKQ